MMLIFVMGTSLDGQARNYRVSRSVSVDRVLPKGPTSDHPLLVTLA